MNIVLWVVAVLLALAFLMSGMMKAFRYEQARQQLPWVKDVPKGLVRFIGVVEILGALGLILPAATGILPWLTPLAAVGLCTVMLLAAGFHAKRHEYSSVGMNLILFLLAAFVAYGHVMLVPVA
jgi:uncharacterized membrane protein YphA (DoxX/SURF4 family)